MMVAGPRARVLCQGMCLDPKRTALLPVFLRASPGPLSPPPTCPCSQPRSLISGCRAGVGAFLLPAHSCWSGRVLGSGRPFLLKEDRGCLAPLPRLWGELPLALSTEAEETLWGHISLGPAWSSDVRASARTGALMGSCCYPPGLPTELRSSSGE